MVQVNGAWARTLPRQHTVGGGEPEQKCSTFPATFANIFVCLWHKSFIDLPPQIIIVNTNKSFWITLIFNKHTTQVVLIIFLIVKKNDDPHSYPKRFRPMGAVPLIVNRCRAQSVNQDIGESWLFWRFSALASGVMWMRASRDEGGGHKS